MQSCLYGGEGVGSYWQTIYYIILPRTEPPRYSVTSETLLRHYDKHYKTATMITKC